MLEKLTARIEELKSSLEKSAANHNALLGALQEASNLYHEMVKAAPIAEEVVQVLAPNEAAVFDAAVSAVESVVGDSQ